MVAREAHFGFPGGGAPASPGGLEWGPCARLLEQMAFPIDSNRQLHLTCPLLQDSTESSAIKEHVLRHTLPLVGHRKSSNEAKRYSRRPLVVVYYGVDFSFDYRVGEARVGGWGVWLLTASGAFSSRAVSLPPFLSA